MGRCSSSLLAARQAELRRTQLARSSRRHIEGAVGCRLTTQCYGAQLRWRGWLSIYLDPQPPLSTFQVGGNRSTRRKPTTFGRALTSNSSHMSVASSNRDSSPWSQRWKVLALTIAPPKPRVCSEFVSFFIIIKERSYCDCLKTTSAKVPSAVYICVTVISFFVKVPVLSEQITVAQPVTKTTWNKMNCRTWLGDITLKRAKTQSMLKQPVNGWSQNF